MVNFTYRGLMTPVFTPFNDDSEQSLNLGIIPKYAQYVKRNGINGVLVNGTNGEGVSQTVEERERTAEAWLATAKTTGLTVMIQVGGTNMKDVCRLAAHAERSGADAILCLADLFHQPKTADDLLRYLQRVGQVAPKTPLLYYHIPGFTGINVNMKELLDKAERGDIKVPTFVGLKFTSHDLNMGASLLTVNPDKYAVFLGSDSTLAGALCLGFNSAIGGSQNMFPELSRTIFDAIKNGDLEAARKAQNKLGSVVRSITSHGAWVGGWKSLMRAICKDFDVGPVRHPLRNLTEDQIVNTIQELGRQGVNFF